jgi:hypothetical protein
MPYIRRANPKTGEFVESGNPCPTEESLYNCCDLDWVLNRFKDDFFMPILLARANLRNNTPSAAYTDIENLARDQGIPAEIGSPEELNRSLEIVLNDAALYASVRIVDEIEEFSRAHNQRVLYVLSHVQAHVQRMLEEGYRFDQPFVDYLRTKGLPFVDLMEVHRKDFEHFNGTVADYLKRYYIGHYNPEGNRLTAFAIKDRLVEMMDPKPPAY